jgi:DNA topoisomerase-1
MPLDSELDGPDFAEAAGLTYVNDHDPGLRRVRRGKGFGYRDADGRTVTDRVTLERVRALVIPPAWTDVWICPDPDGHIQATGRDQRGRKQYIYHPRWREHREESKYAHMAAFGRALPRLRERVERDLKLRGLPREKVLAAVVRLLELTLIRVGNDEYARQNKSFGLTTLKDRHVRFEGSADAVFEFKGKSGVVHRTGIHDRRLARIVRACQEIPGQRLFQYLDEDGERRAVSSQDVNAYIREATGGPFSAKDFRTWAGTLACAQGLLQTEAPASPTHARRTVSACVKEVARQLGNTPSVCRSSYIHPAVIQCYTDGQLAERLAAGDPEGALLEFLDTLQDEAARAA